VVRTDRRIDFFAKQSMNVELQKARSEHDGSTTPPVIDSHPHLVILRNVLMVT
jgi:hypothetical protein